MEKKQGGLRSIRKIICMKKNSFIVALQVRHALEAVAALQPCFPVNNQRPADLYPRGFTTRRRLLVNMNNTERPRCSAQKHTEINK